MKSMKRKKWLSMMVLAFFCVTTFMQGFALADDTCVFGNEESEDVKPNIVLLLENGIEMRHTTWHKKFDNTKDYLTGVILSSVAPGNGPEAGNTLVTITGRNFADGAVVKFGTVSATNVTVVSDTEITCKSPAGTGTVEISVTVGTKSASRADAFVYGTLPVTITTVDPASGTTAGGTSVTITGSNFAYGAAVKFGTASATGVSVNSDTQITCTSPAGAAGAVDVTVTNSDSTSGQKTGGFTYVMPTNPPNVTSVSPTTAAAGATVTITGTDFADGVTVKFGSASATISSSSSTSIVCVVPAGSGTVNVTVSNPDAQSDTVSFTYSSGSVTYVLTVSSVSEPNANSDKFNADQTLTGANSHTSGTITAETIANNASSGTITVTVTSGTTFTDGETVSNGRGATAVISSIATGGVNAFGGSGGGGDSSDGSYTEDSSSDTLGSAGTSGGLSTAPDGVGVVASLTDGVDGFFNALGYGIDSQGGYMYLVKVLDNLEFDSYNNGWKESGTKGEGYFTFNGKTVKLPTQASTTKDSRGIIDGAGFFVYSANYLNWIFFSWEYNPATDGVLPDKSRFYWAKYAVFMAAKVTENKARLAINNFTSNADGASNVQPFKDDYWDTSIGTSFEDMLDSAFVNNVNNMGTVDYSPLAEGLASVGGYFESNSSGLANTPDCADNFAIVITPGISSEDLSIGSSSEPNSLDDYDGDGKDSVDYTNWGTIQKDGVSLEIPMNYNGSTYLDDIASYMYSHDMVPYLSGTQNVMTYTVGFMGNEASNAFLINTSNNGNGFKNLYDSSNPEYGNYHASANYPQELAAKLLEIISKILSRTNTFTAPVVPVTRTTSGNTIYMAFFKPKAANFWEGNLTKFGLSNDLQIQDASGNAATESNGALKDSATPYWQVIDWANSGKPNFMDNGLQTSGTSDDRTIYTHIGTGKTLTAFSSSSDDVKTAVGTKTVGSITYSAEQIINYVRGADVQNSSGNNRTVITGDILHSEPAVVRYTDADFAVEKIRVLYASNDGMLHAVNDADGKEAWAFIPNDQLSRLGLMLDDKGHQFYVDGSPRVWISENIKYNGYVDSGEQAILVCGERKGGNRFFALDVTSPDSPTLLWWIDQNTTGFSELGESWSEPSFGKVKTSDSDTSGTDVVFIGGGYSAADPNTKGRALFVVNLKTGALVKAFTSSDNSKMTFSFPSAAFPVDIENDGFTDKVYIGDIGGQMWRFAKVDSAQGIKYADENINSWTAHVLFTAPEDTAHVNAANASDPVDRKFFYPPTVTLEKNFDLVFMTTGDRENPCDSKTSDKIYAVKDDHDNSSTPVTESDLTNVTSSTNATIDYGTSDGWYINLSTGEKPLSNGTVFYGVYYVTTFTPITDDPCAIGGIGKLWGVGYKNGNTVSELAFTGDSGRSTTLGGGIPSKPVLVLTEEGAKLLISVGSTEEKEGSTSTGAGVVAADPLISKNFFELWWRQLTN
ncbi:MAG: IPT/TIG domain-containing protein [Desulfococcaceae bacterium]